MNGFSASGAAAGLRFAGCGCGCGGGAAGSVPCGCCAAIQALTPAVIQNRPGLAALQVRIGTHASFLETMLARLTTHALDAAAPPNPAGAATTPPSRPLAALKLRAPSDAAVALLDGFATLADVLTFYQERVANEGYLRTATELRSLHELARLVGYRPRPGVAASAYLAYTIAANTVGDIVVPQGARAQTVPGQGELPQPFETAQDLTARAGWNALGLRMAEPQQWDAGAVRPVLYLAGTQTRLKAGDALLVDMPPAPGSALRGLPLPYRVLAVGEDPKADRTTVEVERWDASALLNRLDQRLQALRDQAPDGKVAAEVIEQLQRLNHAAGLAGAAATVDSAGSAGGAGVASEAAAGQAAVLAAVRELVAKRRAEVNGLPAPRLKPWLAAVAAALEAAPVATAPGTAAGAAAASVAAPASAAASSSPGIATTLEARLARLAAPPSKPLANALQLQRSLATGFRPNADAGLKVLGATSPALQDGLAAAVAGFADPDTAPGLRVYALRLRAGLFGRAFPRRSRTVFDNDRDSHIEDAGEWPVVGLDVAVIEGPGTLRLHESPTTLYLDAQHDGIAPGSWVFVDASALPAFDKRAALAVAAQPLLVARAQSVAAKVARADYGGSADTTAITLGDEAGQPQPWLHYNVASAADYKGLHSALTDENDHLLIRRVAVYAQSELLALADKPLDAPLCSAAAAGQAAAAGAIELDGLYTGLEPGRFVIVTGERADIGATAGVQAAEPAMITAVVHDVRAAGNVAGPWQLALAAQQRAGVAITKASADVASGAVSADGATPPTPPAPPTPPLPQPQPLPKLRGDRTHTFIWLDQPLAYCYRRASVRILGNVVRASHGETRVETLGSGNGAQALPTFELKNRPLTYVAAATAAGAASTLEVRVNGVRWQEVDSMVDAAPTERIFMTRTDDTATTRVTFGNGREGARLPTGIGNVQALYRSGIGQAGNVRAGQISQLATRPLGVKDVVNPLRSSGGADADGPTQVRQNAPLAVQALDRVVSTQDVADFARSFAGIEKADAQQLSDGRRSTVHLTVAGHDDIPVDPDSDLLRNLRRALRALGDPFEPLQVVPRELRLLVLSAQVRIAPDHRWEPVATALRAALLDAFGFARRALAQGVAASEVLAAMQAVQGVDWIDLDAFGAIDTVLVDSTLGPRPLTPDETAAAVQAVVAAGAAPVVQAARARREAGVLRPAQIACFRADVPDALVLNQRL